MKKTAAFLTLLMAVSSPSIIAQEKSANAETDKNLLIEILQGINNTTQKCCDFDITTENKGDYYSYSFMKEGKDSYITVLRSAQTYSIFTNTRIKLPEKHYLFAYDTPEGVAYYVSLAGRRASLEVEDVANILMANREMVESEETAVKGQIRQPNNNEDQQTEVSINQQQNKPLRKDAAFFSNLSFNKPIETDLDLLSYKNTLLTQRKVALIITLSGSTVGVVGASMMFLGMTDPSDVMSEIGKGIMIGGGIVAAAGGIWCVINEFNLMNCERKINDALTLRFGPTGIAIQF